MTKKNPTGDGKRQGGGGSGKPKPKPVACPNWVQGRPCSCSYCTAGGR